MDPYDEQKLRDEVIYLHYLWHQGPPHHHHHHHQPNPIPSSSWQQHQFPPSHTRSLPPIISTSFKKNNRKNNRRKGRKPDPSRSPGPAWPCPPPPESPKPGWPEPKPKSDPPLLQPQEKERLSALKAQNKACKSFREFLIGFDEEENEIGDEEDDDEDRLEEFEEFFVEIFKEDNELRGYYQKCFEKGEFFCFVCGAAEKKKSGKRYKDCIGLVQHSRLILRTPNKTAHRAFGQAVCKVLGWDINRLPNIVMKGEPLMQIKPTEDEPKKSMTASDDGKDDSSKTEDIAVSLEHVKDLCSSKEGDIDEKVVNVGLENEGGSYIL